MKYIFVVDSGLNDGVGHIMRTLPLAEELKKRNHQVIYVGSEEFPTWVLAILEQSQFQIEELHRFSLKEHSEYAILVIDSYSETLIADCISKNSWLKIIRVSDIYTPLFNCDFNINISVLDQDFDDGKSTSGALYFPIRNSINKISDLVKFQDFPVISVLAGGNDSTNFLSNISMVLAKIDTDFTCNFFLNSNSIFNSNFPEDKRFRFYPLGQELDKIGNMSNLAFVTASTTAVEFAARGCVTGILSVSENQLQFEGQLISSGIALKIGDYSNGSFIFDEALISKLIEDKFFRLDNLPFSKLDNMGSSRIIDKMEQVISN